MDLARFRDPIEVWRAAIGDSAPLASRLRSAEPIYDLEREVMALFFEGKLKPPQRQKEVPPPQSILQEYQKNTKLRIYYACVHYKDIMEQLQKCGKGYRRSDEVFAYVSEKHKLPVQQIIDAVRRGNLEQPKPQPKSVPASNAERQKERFRYWCFCNWEDVQQFRAESQGNSKNNC